MAEQARPLVEELVSIASAARGHADHFVPLARPRRKQRSRNKSTDPSGPRAEIRPI
jgi:hypothetical protein